MNHTWYLVLFSCENQVQSLRIPGVNVHRVNKEIPFTYMIRIHYMRPKAKVIEMKVTEEQVSLLFIPDLKTTVTAITSITYELTYQREEYMEIWGKIIYTS